MQIHLPNQVQECITIRGKEPLILIQGIWLSEFGFKAETMLEMKIEAKKIIITSTDHGDTGTKK